MVRQRLCLAHCRSVILSVHLCVSRLIGATWLTRGVLVGTDASFTAWAGDIVAILKQDVEGNRPREVDVFTTGRRRGCCHSGGCLLTCAEGKIK